MTEKNENSNISILIRVDCVDPKKGDNFFPCAWLDIDKKCKWMIGDKPCKPVRIDWYPIYKIDELEKVIL